MGLVDDLLSGSPRALARLSTHVENDDDLGREALERLYPHTGRAHRIGITGPPGAGKSTLINALVSEYRKRGGKVGVVAIDPSSPISGGATLGDRIRMLDQHADPGVFIRSMASRGHKGGLAPATIGVAHLMDAAGFDVVFIETVGVGQEQIDVSLFVHTLLLIQIPGTGDSVQLLKAGLLELADIYVVNKADLDGAEELVRGLRSMVGYSAEAMLGKLPQVIRCIASSGEGIPKIADAIGQHLIDLTNDNLLEAKQQRISRNEVIARVTATAIRNLRDLNSTDSIDELIARVAAREISPNAAAAAVLRKTVS